LDPLNEDSLLANLLSRFKRDHIYVSCCWDRVIEIAGRLGGIQQQSTNELISYIFPVFPFGCSFFRFFSVSTFLGGFSLVSGIGELIDRKTYIGNILLSINPYKPLAQYTEQAIADYKLRTVAISQLPPHV
jgi:hypothetical protein